MNKKILKQKIKNLEKFQNEFEGLNETAKENDIFILEEFKEIILYNFKRCKKVLKEIIRDADDGKNHMENRKKKSIRT